MLYLKLLRAGGMDLDGALKVLKNFLGQINNSPKYTAKVSNVVGFAIT